MFPVDLSTLPKKFPQYRKRALLQEWQHLFANEMRNLGFNQIDKAGLIWGYTVTCGGLQEMRPIRDGIWVDTQIESLHWVTKLKVDLSSFTNLKLDPKEAAYECTRWVFEDLKFMATSVKEKLDNARRV